MGTRQEKTMTRTFIALMLALPAAAFAADPDASFYTHAAEGGIAVKKPDAI
jgi:hypothetical protein